MDSHSRQPGRPDGPPVQHEPARDRGEPAIADRIRLLKARSSRGLYSMVAFIAVSIVAVCNLATYQELPESFRIFLGTPPSATMISAALIVYS
ncbi:MAG TPA: menaquinol oxidoreductase, partial [Geobacteraceae bacterium]